MPLSSLLCYSHLVSSPLTSQSLLLLYFSNSKAMELINWPLNAVDKIVSTMHSETQTSYTLLGLPRPWRGHHHHFFFFSPPGDYSILTLVAILFFPPLSLVITWRSSDCSGHYRGLLRILLPLITSCEIGEKLNRTKRPFSPTHTHASKGNHSHAHSALKPIQLLRYVIPPLRQVVCCLPTPDFSTLPFPHCCIFLY